jgi:hypothetical protein
MVRGAVLLSAAVFTALTTLAQSPDAARVLAGMHAALGGEALDRVRAFSADGEEERRILDMTARYKVEWICALPDRFINVEDNQSAVGRVVETSGFNGDGLVILRDVATSLNVRRPALQAQSVGDYAATLRSSVTTAKRQFSRRAIALLGITDAYPLEASFETRETIEGREMDVLRLTHEDGYEARLYVDASTQLPLMVSWTGRPETAYGRSSAEVKNAAAQPPVERRLLFRDYKTTSGVRWPHRFTEVAGGEVVRDLRLWTFKINPKIDPARFVTVNAAGR